MPDPQADLLNFTFCVPDPMNPNQKISVDFDAHNLTSARRCLAIWWEVNTAGKQLKNIEFYEPAIL